MTELGGQEAFLQTIAQKLGRPRRSGVTPPVWERQALLRPAQNPSREELLQQFAANLEAQRTQVVRVTAAEFPRALAEALDDFSVQSAIYWYDPLLEQLQLAELLTEHQVQHTACPEAVRADFRATAAQADLGITTARLAVAETGTIVLFNGGRRGRIASLLPPHYLVILREEQIVPTLAEVMTHIKQEVAAGLPACINLITGPSRSADIEGDLAIGVHGPGNVRVIVLGGDENL